jgi:hypothetical protein
MEQSNQRLPSGINTIQSVHDVPQSESKTTPFEDETTQMEQFGQNRMTRKKITTLAKIRGTKGITFKELTVLANIAPNKAQDVLKRYKKLGVICTVERSVPQRYYDPSVRSDVIKSKNTLLHHTGVTTFGNDTLTESHLIGHVLPLLPEAPLFIHKMNFTTKYNPIHYKTIDTEPITGNKGKQGRYPLNYAGSWHEVKTMCYPDGTMNIYTTSSRTPLKIENDSDRVNLIGFLGAVHSVASRFTSEIAPVSEWFLSQCDINKDINISDQFHYNGINVQVKHVDRMFSIYVKPMGVETVCRVERQLAPKKPAIEAINEIMHPWERPIAAIQSQIFALQSSTTMMGVNN